MILHKTNFVEKNNLLMPWKHITIKLFENLLQAFSMSKPLKEKLINLQ